MFISKPVKCLQQREQKSREEKKNRRKKEQKRREEKIREERRREKNRRKEKEEKIDCVKERLAFYRRFIKKVCLRIP